MVDKPWWRTRLDSIANLLSGFGDPERDKGAAGTVLAFNPLPDAASIQ